jgi:hypothetical protein
VRDEVGSDGFLHRYRLDSAFGQGLAAVSGYDPNGMAGFLVSLDRPDRLRTGVARSQQVGEKVWVLKERRQREQRYRWIR